MNIPDNADIADMGWSGTKIDKVVSWRIHNYFYPAFLHECVGGYVKGKSMPDV